MSFDTAIDDFYYARAAVTPGLNDLAADRMIGKVDRALDRLLAVPSPSLNAFFQKIKILQAEYGLYAQPRHLAAIYVDVLLLASLLIS